MGFCKIFLQFNNFSTGKVNFLPQNAYIAFYAGGADIFRNR